MGSYRRNGEGDYRCTRDEVDSMLRDAAGGSQDIQVFGDMGMEVLDGDTVERYRQEYFVCHPEEPPAQLSVPEFLEKLGAMETDGSGISHVTAAGLLMFGREPEIIKKFSRFHLEYTEEGDAASNGIFQIPETGAAACLIFICGCQPELCRQAHFYRKDRRRKEKDRQRKARRRGFVRLLPTR